MSQRLLLDRIADRAIRMLPPRPRLALSTRKALRRLPDLAMAARLCRPERGAIDVGANVGLFSCVMAQRAAWCAAFEPNEQLAAQIKAALPQIQVYALGLADAAGAQTLSTPIVDGVAYNGYASMAGSSALREYPHATATVPVRTLDSFALKNVGLVKIDVEGFEERVLDGAAQTIQRERPILLIEIEERHNPGGRTRIAGRLRTWGYGAGQPVPGAENNLVFRAA